MLRHGCCVDKHHHEQGGGAPDACDDRTCMQLPDGKTCGDCLSFKACLELGITTEHRDYCDFFPRLFVELKPKTG